MSEVKRFITRYSRDFQGNLQEDPNGSWVLAADAAIRDRKLMDKIDVLQQRLTAADEALDSTRAELAWQESDNAELRKREDVLEGLLLRTNELLYEIQGDPDSVPSSAIDAMRGEVFTALKPAEGGGDDLDEHDRSSQAYWDDQAAQGKPYEQQLREACERNGIDLMLDTD